MRKSLASRSIGLSRRAGWISKVLVLGSWTQLSLFDECLVNDYMKTSDLDRYGP